MRKSIILSIAFILVAVFCRPDFSLAETEIRIGDEAIPVFSGAERMNIDYDEINAQVITYATRTSVSEVSDFYRDFLNKNGYQSIGNSGEQKEYNVMVQKGLTKFSLRIYSQSNATRIEFIW